MFSYPPTKKVDFKAIYHDCVIEDPFVWLENATDPAVISWVAAQNKFTTNFFENNYQNLLESRFKELKDKAQKKAPLYNHIIEHNDIIYATKIDNQGEYSLVKLTKDFQEIETVLNSASFDNKMMVYALTPSPVKKELVFVIAMIHGAARPSLLIYDLSTATVLKQFDNVFSASFSATGDQVYFSDAEAKTKEGFNINRIKVFDIVQNKITTLFEYDQNSPFFTLTPSSCGRYIGVQVMLNYVDADLIIIDTHQNSLQKIVLPQKAAVKYLGTIDKRHYLKTNLNAENGKIIALPLTASSLDEAEAIIPNQPYIIDEAVVVQDKIVVAYLKDVASDLVVFNQAGKHVANIELPSELGSVGGLQKLENMGISDSPNLYIPFQSFLDSPCILKYNLETQTIKTVHKSENPAIPSDIKVSRVFITAKDGAKIPAFIVHKKDVKLNGQNPTIMYGYGGYNLSMPPVFHNFFLGLDIWEWVAKGYVYVNCNIRGGNEYGTQWHRQGNLENKKNVFYDFIDITQWLIDNKWTCQEKIAIVGGSNGGLLVTALATMRPDLFGSVIASVPHTDMIRFKNDDRGPMYITEYGDIKERGMFEYIKSYSPYHNILKTKYPAIYIQTGEQDNNVPPYHGKKFAAKMQMMNQSDKPVLLRVLKDGAHDRGKGDVMYQTFAEMQIFLEQTLKI